MALLYLLDALHLNIDVAHLEHGMRAESLQDADFVETVCAERGLTFHMERADVPSLARMWKCGPEDAARRARYDFLERTRERIGADCVALAHHRMDQAETILLQMTRGTGLSGLSGMKQRRGLYIRPLLNEDPATLRTALLELGKTWCEDATNADETQPRAIMRHVVLPALSRVNPEAVAALCRVAQIVAAEDDYIESQIDLLWDGRFRLTDYGGYIVWVDTPHPVLAARLLRCAAPKMDMPVPEAAAITRMLALTERSRGTLSLTEGWTMMRTPERLHFMKPGVQSPELQVNCQYHKVEHAVFDNDPHTQVVDEELIAGAVWRTGQPGDWIWPLGAPGRKLLSDYWIDRKIDRPFRPYVPLLVRDSEVLWVVGVGISQTVRVTPTTRQAVRLHWLGNLPWEGKP